jgi:transcriptional regulator with XRE-family HTH domain
MKLAELIGVSYQQIQKYESGMTRLTVDRLEQIAAALGAPLIELLATEPSRASEASHLYGELSPDERELVALWRRLDDDPLRAAVLAILRSLPPGR